MSKTKKQQIKIDHEVLIALYELVVVIEQSEQKDENAKFMRDRYGRLIWY